MKLTNLNMNFFYNLKSSNKNTILIAVSSSLVVFSLNFYIIALGHLHEDAYIMFTYVENWVSNGLIGFSFGTGKSEGATDFLWMIALIGFNLLGLNVALSAAIINSIGVFALTYLVIGVYRRFDNSLLIPLLLGLFIPISYISQASIAGFSTAIYSTIIAYLIIVILFSKEQKIIIIPFIGLLLALIRPDGAILGVVASLGVFFLLSPRHKKSYLIFIFFTAILGLIYFLWRWNYFGELLPLPLIVKSKSDQIFPGFFTNLNFLSSIWFLVVLSVANFFSKHVSKARLSAAVIPVLLHFIMLTFVEQSQNVALRFQSPMFVLLIILSTIFVANWINFSKRKTFKKSKHENLLFLILPLFILILLPLAIKNAYSTARLVYALTNSNYINFFPYYLSEYVDKDTKIALTEAGRLPYWIPGKKFDLVGLNTPETAKKGVSVKYIKNLSPDLIMAHHARLLKNLSCKIDEKYCIVRLNQLKNAAIKGSSQLYLKSNNSVKRASAATIKFLIENYSDYTVILVRYGNTVYTHIYGLKKNSDIELENFFLALDKSFNSDYSLSYLQMIMEPK
jgi:hypothetical protein